MSKHSKRDPGSAPVELSRWTRLHGLLFAGAALGTTLLALGATGGPKLPPATDE